MSIKVTHQKHVFFGIAGIILGKGLKFPSFVCNGCHGILLLSFYINNIAILDTHDNGNPCIILRVNKSEAIKMMENSLFNDKGSL